MKINSLDIQEEIDNIVQKVYPVGSIYISTNDTNPSTLFGGEWESFGTGKTLVGIDSSQTEFDSSEKTGGEKTHILNINELPRHTHTLTNTSHTHTINLTTRATAITGSFNCRGLGNDNDTSTEDLADAIGVGSNGTTGAFSKTDSTWAGSHSIIQMGKTISNTRLDVIHLDGEHTHTVSGNSGSANIDNAGLTSTGNGLAHNNLQPYIVVYMWKRVS